jgi:hypothetical protein
MRLLRSTSTSTGTRGMRQALSVSRWSATQSRSASTVRSNPTLGPHLTLQINTPATDIIRDKQRKGDTMMNKYDMADIILSEPLLGGKKMDPKAVLLDMIEALDDRAAERALRSVAKTWGISLSAERDRNDD